MVTNLVRSRNQKTATKNRVINLRLLQRIRTMKKMAVAPHLLVAIKAEAVPNLILVKTLNMTSTVASQAKNLQTRKRMTMTTTSTAKKATQANLPVQVIRAVQATLATQVIRVRRSKQ